MITVSLRRRVLVLAICYMSLLMINIDNTALNVALPSLQRELHASVRGLQWVIDGYTLVLASFVMLAGSIADLLGRRRVFAVGLALFTLGSMACAFAPGVGWLIVFRAVQAVGGSMLNPVGMAIITNIFTDPKERARAIGVGGAVVGISAAGGPLLGGLLVESMSWRSIFWVNIPVGFVGLLLIARFVPESKSPQPRRIDPIDQILVMVVLGSLSFGVIEGGVGGWTSPLILGCFLVTACASAMLIYHGRRCEQPLIEMGFFRSLPFGGANVLAVIAFAALGAFLFSSTLYLQNDRGMSALEAGIQLLPMPIMIAVCAPLSGFLVGSYGARLPLVLAGVGMMASGFLFAEFGAQTSNSLLFIAYTLFGIGFGFVNPPITNSAVSELPRARAGVAAGIASTSRHVGSALGVAVIGAVIVTGAQTLAWWLITGCGVAVFLIGLLITGDRAKASAEHMASTFHDLTAHSPDRGGDL
ncbi:MFS transporter [Streptomyces asiaticus]|uniref:MFS transporter n=1 Tax=Streptomyces asiaticus TaxID=114695 RepID=UPI003F67F3E6